MTGDEQTGDDQAGDYLRSLFELERQQVKADGDGNKDLGENKGSHWSLSMPGYG